MNNSLLRLLSLITAALVVILALAVGAMRWVGQQRPVEIPLPAADGCWLSICFFEPMNVEDLPATLNADPSIVDGSAVLMTDLQPGGNYLIELEYMDSGAKPRPVMLFWLPHTYSIVRDWQNPKYAPLWYLGDILQAYGEPFMVTFLSDQIILHYPDRHLQVVFFPSEREFGWARITPEDAVTSVNVLSDDITSGDPTQIYYPPASEWLGFGVYQFDG